MWKLSFKFQNVLLCLSYERILSGSRSLAFNILQICAKLQKRLHLRHRRQSTDSTKKQFQKNNSREIIFCQMHIFLHGVKTALDPSSLVEYTNVRLYGGLIGLGNGTLFRGCIRLSDWDMIEHIFLIYSVDMKDWQRMRSMYGCINIGSMSGYNCDTWPGGPYISSSLTWVSQAFVASCADASMLESSFSTIWCDYHLIWTDKRF